MIDLKAQLGALDDDTRAALEKCGFDEARFLALAATLQDGDPRARRATRNRVKGPVRAPLASELTRAPEDGAEHERLRAVGRAALERGEVAFCVLAGGMATRMGGVVKALVPAVLGKTFLELRLAENEAIGARARRPVPLWLMTSDATDQATREALAAARAGRHVAAFQQDLSLRLTPEGSLFRDRDGAPSVHATGHGDLPDAVRRSGLLEAFVASGGKTVWIANLDNLGAGVDELILGAFLESGKKVMVEVAPKEPGDRGGIPVHADGKIQVLEEFRLPDGFDPRTVDVFNTNTFLVDADALARAPFTWTYFEVEKRVDDRPAIQFERLLQEITAHLESAYLVVSRDGARSRFLPVKDYDELAQRRADIEAVARARGMV